jgi:hypothetical protein
MYISVNISSAKCHVFEKKKKVINQSCRKIDNTHFMPHMISLKVVQFQSLLNK